jgi:acyl carrier protein
MNIEQRLFKIVNTEFNKKKHPNLSLDMNFKKDLGLDSLSLTELLIACDEEFSIDIDIEEHPEIGEVRTLRSLHDSIAKILNQRELS